MCACVCVREGERERDGYSTPCHSRSIIPVAGPLPPVTPQHTLRNTWGHTLLHNGDATCTQVGGSNHSTDPHSKDLPTPNTQPPSQTQHPSPRVRAPPNIFPISSSPAHPSWSQNPVSQDAPWTLHAHQLLFLGRGEEPGIRARSGGKTGRTGLIRQSGAAM